MTRLWVLTLKSEQYIMDPKHTMVEHLREILAIICDLNVVDNNLTNK